MHMSHAQSTTHKAVAGKLVMLGVHGAQLVFTGGQDVAGLVAQLAHLLPQGISLPCSAPYLCL